VSLRRLRLSKGSLTAEQKSAEDVVGQVVGKASKELLRAEPVRYAALSSMGTSS
jgi:hypothetical protein